MTKPSWIPTGVSEIKRRRREKELKRDVGGGEGSAEGQSFVLQTLIDSIPNPIFYKDVDGVYLGCNKAFEDYIGMSRDRVAGSTVYDVAPGELADRYKEMDDELLRERRTQVYEASVKYADGTVHDVMFNKATFDGADGDLAGLVGVMIDISDRKRAELEAKRAYEELEDREVRLRGITQAAKDAVLLVDSAGNIVQWNPAAERIFGYSADEIVGRPVYSLMQGDVHGWHKEVFSRLAASAGTSSYHTHAEHSSLRKDGSEFPAEVSVSQVEIKGEKFVTLIIRDITERKRAQREIVEAKEQWEKSFNAINDAIFIIDKDYKVIRHNKAFAELLGHHEDINGHHCYELVHDADAPPPFCVTGNAVREGAGVRAEIFEEHIGKYLAVSADPSFGPDGEFEFAIHMARDITDRKRAEEELKTVNKELESFSYSVSHDLRAPLRAIDGFSRMLKEKQGEELDAEGNRLLDVVIENTVHMGDLIEELLALSRAGRQELMTVELDMKELARVVWEELGEIDSAREIEFKVGELPPARGDSILVQQVLVNLISNSVKFTAGDGKAMIDVGSTGKEDGNNVYFVKDNGVGFDMKYYDRLFGVFQRLHSADEFEGTGAGLAIVQRIVNRHGGRVWAEGEVGRGATFYFTLPDIE